MKITGFTLIEMAMVMSIVGLLLAGLLPTITSQIEQQRRNETRKQLAEIQQALMGFAIMNGRLPCPTTQTDPSSNLYGQEDATCPTGTPTTDGYLPWKTLGVSEVDAWGSKRTSTSSPWTGYWRYRTDRNFSKSSSLITLTTGFSSDSLAIIDTSGASLISTSERPIAIVFSTGPDLVGNGQNAITSFQQTSATYQSDVPSSGFDDMLIWISRPQLFNRLVAAGKLP
jgi:prepilin-type N-terminal cleavage/methylation domain-containing protein